MFLASLRSGNANLLCARTTATKIRYLIDISALGNELINILPMPKSRSGAIRDVSFITATICFNHFRAVCVVVAVVVAVVVDDVDDDGLMTMMMTFLLLF